MQWAVRIIRCSLALHLLSIAPPLVAQSGSAKTRAQPPDARVVDVRGEHAPFSFWMGFSSNSRGPLGAVADREFFIAGVRYSRIIAASRRMSLEYVFDVIPVAVVTDNPDADAYALLNNTWLWVEPGPRSPVYGAGLSPLGFQFTPWRASRFRLVTGGTGGMLWFSRGVPFRNARRFNYTFEFGGGIQLFVTNRLGITVGYKLHHLSNAGTGEINPGLDANLVFLEITPR